jgi:hypothetical protein
LGFGLFRKSRMPGALVVVEEVFGEIDDAFDEVLLD